MPWAPGTVVDGVTRPCRGDVLGQLFWGQPLPPSCPVCNAGSTSHLCAARRIVRGSEAAGSQHAQGWCAGGTFLRLATLHRVLTLTMKCVSHFLLQIARFRQALSVLQGSSIHKFSLSSVCPPCKITACLQRHHHSQAHRLSLVLLWSAAFRALAPGWHWPLLPSQQHGHTCETHKSLVWAAGLGALAHQWHLPLLGTLWRRMAAAPPAGMGTPRRGQPSGGGSPRSSRTWSRPSSRAGMQWRQVRLDSICCTSPPTGRLLGDASAQAAICMQHSDLRSFTCSCRQSMVAGEASPAQEDMRIMQSAAGVRVSPHLHPRSLSAPATCKLSCLGPGVPPVCRWQQALSRQLHAGNAVWSPHCIPHNMSCCCK